MKASIPSVLDLLYSVPYTAFCLANMNFGWSSLKQREKTNYLGQFWFFFYYCSFFFLFVLYYYFYFNFFLSFLILFILFKFIFLFLLTPLLPPPPTRNYLNKPLLMLRTLFLHLYSKLWKSIWHISRYLSKNRFDASFIYKYVDWN